MRVLDQKGLLKRSGPEEGRRRYGLLVEDVEAEGFRCESYGFLIADDRAGTEARCRHVTVDAGRALELLGRLVHYEVSPIHLLDVIEDQLGG